MNGPAVALRPGFEAVSGRLTWEGHDLERLAREYGTPLYVVSRPTLEERLHHFSAAFRSRAVEAQICFPVKTNPMKRVKILSNRSWSPSAR